MQPSTPEQKRAAASLLAAGRDTEAVVLLQAGPHLYENVGSHRQQAKKKYLQAVPVASSLPAPLIQDFLRLLLPFQKGNITQLTPQDLPDATLLNEFAVELRYETDDAPSHTSDDLLAMAHRFRTALHPLAPAFLI